MKFEVKERRVNYSDEFVVHLVTIGKDNELYKFSMPGFKKDSGDSMRLLEDLVLTLRRMFNNSVDEDGSHDYIDGFKRWFKTHEWDEKNPEYSKKLFEENFKGRYFWPENSELGKESYLYSYLISYYNEDGVEFAVEY